MMNINKRMIGWVSVMAGILMFAAACNETLNVDPLDTTPPEITGFTPKVGQIGTMVSITGTHLRDVTTIKIGGVEANVIRVNRTLVMAEITKDNLSGKIEVTSPYGTAVAEEDFVIEYLRPKVTEYPSEAGVFTAMVIKGENLDLVNEISFGTKASVAKSNFELQSDEKIEIIVPYYESDGAVDLVLKYNYGIEPTELVIEDAFTLDATAPSVASISEKASVGSTFDIEGSNLNVVEKVLLEGKVLTIVQSAPEKLTCLVPGDFTPNSAAKVELVYFDGNIQQQVGVINVRIPATYIWKNVKLQATYQNFFSGTTGKYYTVDEFTANKNDIHLSLLGHKSNDWVQIESLSANANFSGTNVPKDGWPMRFRKLKESNAVDKAYIDKIKNGELEDTPISLAQAVEDGLSMSTKKQVIRYKFAGSKWSADEAETYNQTNDEGIGEGCINLVMLLDASSAVVNIAFVEFVSVYRSPDVSDSSMTVNFYFPKEAAN